MINRSFMTYAQLLIGTLLVFWSSAASASWLATVGTNGFFGRYSAGVAYSNGQHETELSLGVYTQESRHFNQLNLIYRYSPWTAPVLKGQMWHPLEIGVFGTYSLDTKNYFTSSPTRYPYPDYYDQTALRWGFEVSNSILLPKYSLSAAYHIRILDTGIIAAYNNDRKDLQYYISSGFSLRYHF